MALLVVSCASGGLKPGTGDISFRLTWSGVVDLDLYVISPLGERLSFIRREVESGGVLDVDCNVRPDPTRVEVEGTSWVCPLPMENIFWPRGAAPEGVYKYWLVLAEPEGMTAADSYRLEVRHGRRVVRAHSGRIEDLLEGQPPHQIDFARP